ncbi:hypothetical protein VOI32_14050 [Paraburkholderia caribensis]|uniref:Uncharacterized protein n=1 Tax=Paraburkholderia caribensis TaxID=75105 RepID=A0A9Q6WK02_9BURK|nr:hypothetical protein [Paraburkholderia caribensis]MCO4881568.1 hypothetical protein [Paraburkholderia caribensis]PTB24478.1 hypothetical protein C9I56_33475 [Paraburkholderia caribensis]QLB61620.1 hypothetical protein A9O66_04005 [Paraburkholderia caribensis]
MKTKTCPFLKKPCIEHECTMWTHIQGKHPQTGAIQDVWDCSVKWTPVLMVDHVHGLRGIQAAMESARNEITQRQDVLNDSIRIAASRQSARIRDIQPDATPSLDDGHTQH